MPFTVQFPTRHTDTFASTGFVHVGVLLALTELAYAAFEQESGAAKPAHIVAMEVRTRAEYLRPLPWQDGVAITVRCDTVQAAGFTQLFELRSAKSGRAIARIEHDWVWLDTTTGRAVPVEEDAQRRFIALSERQESE